MSVNDYLARRDACWMGDIYRFLGLSTGYVQQGMTPAERRAAYACDITFATANEIGFDVLRDRLALRLDEQVHRPFSTAVIDEVDSILIDEARIPLVIAGGDRGAGALAYVADQVVRRLQPSVHYTVDVGAHNASLTDGGIRAVEDAFGCGNLFEERNLELHTVVQDSLEAHALLRRDVEYLVKGGSIEMVDEFKGRIALNRRWPAGLHTAVETKEGVTPKPQGMVLGLTTIQHLVALYPRVCGMTGTAATQVIEFRTVYGLYLARRSQDHDRNTLRARVCLDCPEHLNTTDLGELEIEEDQPGRNSLAPGVSASTEDIVERFLAVFGNLDGVCNAGLSEGVAKQFQIVGIVLDYQDHQSAVFHESLTPEFRQSSLGLKVK